MYNGRRLITLRERTIRFGVQLLVFFCACSALAVENRWASRSRYSRIGHAHDLVGHAIRFGFERVIDCADGELALKSRSNVRKPAQHGLVADAALAAGWAIVGLKPRWRRWNAAG